MRGTSDRTRPAAVDPDLARQYAALCVTLPPEETDEPEAVEIWARHAETWAVWCCCQTVWRQSMSMAGLIWHGLDYLQLAEVERRHGLSADFRAIQAMELAALPILNEASDVPT